MPLPSPSAVPVLQHWEAYAAACAAAGHAPALGPFAAWLAERVAAAPGPPPPGGLDRARWAGAAAVHAWRYARALRAGFRGRAGGAGLRSPDEFLVLYVVSKRPAPGPSKAAVFRYAGLGATTGGQLLARLVGQGLVAEAADPADGRRTRLRATAAGRAAFGLG